MKVSDVNEDEEVDIETVEKDAFSDSDTSVEELRYLPAEPIPDTNEQQDNIKLIQAHISASPAFEEAVQNGHGADHASSPLGGKKYHSNKLHMRINSLINSISLSV